MSVIQPESIVSAVSPTDTVKKVLDVIVEEQKIKYPDCIVPALFVYDSMYELSNHATWDKDVLESLRLSDDTHMYELLVHNRSIDFAAYATI